MNSLGEHIKDEKQSDLPALEEALAEYPRYSESIAKKFGRLKASVPFRTDPIAGEKPLSEGPIELLLAPLDHITDMVRRIIDKLINSNPSTK